MNALMRIFKRQRGTNDPFNGMELGDRAKDTLTGFEGVIVSTNRNISGCDQVALQPPMRDGKFEQSLWFDIERVVLVEAGAVQFTERRTGADEVPPSRVKTQLWEE